MAERLSKKDIAIFGGGALVIVGGTIAAGTGFMGAPENPIYPVTPPPSEPKNITTIPNPYTNPAQIQTRLATPTEWATWTPQPKATETPAAVATVTGTPTPVRSEEKPTQKTPKYIQENGNWFFKDKGTELVIPKAAGLKIELKQINGQEIAIYTAEEENPYGLREGDYAGFFYADAFRIGTDKEEQVGSAAFNKKVIRYLLQQAGSPSKNVVVPLPVLLTPATTGRLTVEERTMIKYGKQRLFLRMPIGVSLAVPLEKLPNSPVKVIFAPQSWGTVINTGFPNDLLGQFALKIEWAEKLGQKTNDQVLGDSIAPVKVGAFSSSILASYNTHLDNPILSRPNGVMYPQAYVLDQDNEFPWYSLSENDVLKIGKSYLTFSPDNP